MQVIPLSSYFEESALKEERKALRSPYVGHISMVPKVGSFKVLERDNGLILVHDEDGYYLMSNICRHRQALIKEGYGNAKSFQCSVHGWNYEINGELKTAPKFEIKPTCKNLDRTRLVEVNGFLFTEADEEMFDGFELDMTFVEITKGSYEFNWKVVLETYAENYHIASSHPGLRSFVDLNTIKWKFRKDYQKAEAKINPKSSMSIPYQEYVMTLSPSDGDSAAWIIAYPNVMIEFYPGAMVVAYTVATGPDTCDLYTEYYIAKNESREYPQDYYETFKEAYTETTNEDDEICHRLYEGRRSLYNKGEVDSGPIHPHLEAGLEAWTESYNDTLSSYQRNLRALAILRNNE